MINKLIIFFIVMILIGCGPSKNIDIVPDWTDSIEGLKIPYDNIVIK